MDLSRLDYCSCLLMGTPNSVIHPLQKIQNFAARLVLLAPRHHHSAPLLEKKKKLHWFPISERIKCKVASTCFSVINGSRRLEKTNSRLCPAPFFSGRVPFVSLYVVGCLEQEVDLDPSTVQGLYWAEVVLHGPEAAVHILLV